MALSRIFVASKNGQGGVKNSKFFFRKNIRKMEKNLGTSGTIIAQNRFFGEIVGQVSGEGRGWTVPRSRPKSTRNARHKKLLQRQATKEAKDGDQQFCAQTFGRQEFFKT